MQSCAKAFDKKESTVKMILMHLISQISLLFLEPKTFLRQMSKNHFQNGNEEECSLKHRHKLYTGPSQLFTNKFSVSSTFANHNWRRACVKVTATKAWRTLDRKVLMMWAASLDCDTSCLSSQSSSTSQTRPNILGGTIGRRYYHDRWQQRLRRECPDRLNEFAPHPDSWACFVRWRVS